MTSFISPVYRAITFLEGTLGGIKLTTQVVWLPRGSATSFVGPWAKGECGTLRCRIIEFPEGDSRALLSQGLCVMVQVEHPGSEFSAASPQEGGAESWASYTFPAQQESRSIRHSPLQNGQHIPDRQLTTAS